MQNHCRNYLLSPSAVDKLTPLGLTQQEVTRSHLSWVLSDISDDDVLAELRVESMAAEEQTRQFLVERFHSRDAPGWVVAGRAPVRMDNLDYLLYSGAVASHVVFGNLLDNYSAHGFSSWMDCAATIGAYAISLLKTRSEQGYSWTRNCDNGAQLLITLGGTTHKDPCITMQDVAFYPTKDPFGNDVCFRPVASGDFTYMSGSHSQEDRLLASIIRYIDQEKIPSSLQNLAAIDIHVTNPGIGRNIPELRTPMPRLDGNWTASEPSYHRMIANTDYVMFVGPMNELVFTKSGNNVKKKEPHMVFYPHEADHLLKGMYEQARRYLGRTSHQRLEELFNRYRELGCL